MTHTTLETVRRTFQQLQLKNWLRQEMIQAQLSIIERQKCKWYYHRLYYMLYHIMLCFVLSIVSLLALKAQRVPRVLVVE